MAYFNRYKSVPKKGNNTPIFWQTCNHFFKAQLTCISRSRSKS